MMAPPISLTHPISVDTEDLTVRLPSGKALISGVSLSVRPGERVAIVGPNGAGKSTLLRALCGQLIPSAGDVTFNGHWASRLSRLEIAQHIAFVPQIGVADPRLRVVDYVELGRIPHAYIGACETSTEIVGRELARFRLDGLADRVLGSLSGGERQRASLARALAQEPGLLCLDEPTNALDPRARHDLIDLIRGLPITVIAVLHDLPLVSTFASRVAVINNGKLITLAKTESALSQHIVRSVFGMNIVPIIHPTTGRSLLHLEIPDLHHIDARMR